MTEPANPQSDQSTELGSSSRSGGVNITDANVVAHGDIVGRNKIVSVTITDAQQYDVHGLANPYLGLQSFTYADHAKYAGREKLSVETVAHLTAPDEPLSLLFVTGASGCGKSSFVQAGVLPALEKHYAALSVKWAVFRPSRDPMAALADALWRQFGLPQFDAQATSPADFGNFLSSNTPPQQVNVIIIDQFEELFTQAAAQPRNALFNLLTHLPPFRVTHTHIIATVRADYLPELFALPTLYDIAKRGIDLRVMSVDELCEAIQQPLRAAYPDGHQRFQGELVERLAQDASEDAAYLPLLQVTLEEIWRKGTLTISSYTNLADAIEQRADKVLAYQDYDAAQPNQPRPPDEQAAILRLCLDLVDVSLDDEARRDVRRRRSKDELISSAPERARLIDALTQARLLSVDTERSEQTHIEVDIIHETLLSNWDRLRQAIAERRHELRRRVRFEQQLSEWIGQNRSDDYLLSGVHLAEARELDRGDDIALHNADAKDFVHRSVEREEAERQRELDQERQRADAEERARIEAEKRAAAERQRAQILRFAAVVLFGLVLVASLSSLFAFQQRDQANQANATAQAEANKRATAEGDALASANEARARLLVSQGGQVFEDDPLLGIRLGLEGLALASRGQSQKQGDLVNAVAQRMAQGRILKLGNDIEQIFPSPDHQRLVLARKSRPNELRRADGSVITTFPGGIERVVFSPDSGATYFAVTYSGMTAELRRSADGALLAKLDSPVRELKFSHDPAATYLFVSYIIGAELRLTQSGALAPLSGKVADAFFSADPQGSYFVVRYIDRPSELRRTVDGALIAPLAKYALSVSFSDQNPQSNADYAMIEYSDSSFELRRTRDGAVNPLPEKIIGFQFSPDPAAIYLVINYANQPRELRRTTDGSIVQLAGQVSDVTFSPDPSARYFVVTYQNGTKELRRSADASVIPLSGQILNITFSPDPTPEYFVVDYQGKPRELRRTRDNAIITTLQVSGPPLIFSLDSEATFFVPPEVTGQFSVFRSADGSPFEATNIEFVDFKVERTGTYFVTRSADKTIALRRGDGARVATFSSNVSSIDLSPDPDKRYLVVSFEDGHTELWAAGAAPRRVADLGQGVRNLSFDAKAERAVVWYGEGNAYLLNMNLLEALIGISTFQPQELISLGCTYLFVTGQFDASKLKDYLDGNLPQACH